MNIDVLDLKHVYISLCYLFQASAEGLQFIKWLTRPGSRDYHHTDVGGSLTPLCQLLIKLITLVMLCP